MSKKQLFIGTIFILVSTIAYATTEIIKFGSGIYPPFTILNDASQELEGFDIDIAKALCEKIKAKCTFTNDQFKNMVTSLNTKKYDAWINAITINEERKKEVTFSQSYFSTSALLIASKNTTFNASPIEIKDKTIGVGSCTCYVEYLKNTYGDKVKIKTFNTKNGAYEALLKGLIDAVIDDSAVLKSWLSMQENRKQYRIIRLPAKYSELIWQRYGIAVAKSNNELAEKLNNALISIKSDGTYQKIVDKYFENHNLTSSIP